MTSIADAIKARRIQKGLKQKEFAEQLGITMNYLSYLESSRRMPSNELLNKIFDNNIPDNLLNFVDEASYLLQFPNNLLIKLLEKEGLITKKKLKNLISQDNSNFGLKYLLLRLLLTEGNDKEAREVFAEQEEPNSLILEGHYFQFKRKWNIAIECMTEALKKEENKQEKNLKKIAEINYKIGCIYYDWVSKDIRISDISLAMSKLEKSLFYLDLTMNYDDDPFFFYDKANVYYSIAFLQSLKGENAKNIINNYYKALHFFKETIRHDYYKKIDFSIKNGMNLTDFPLGNSIYGDYSYFFIFEIYSFIIRTYGEIAFIEDDKSKRFDLFNEAEIFINSILPLSSNKIADSNQENVILFTAYYNIFFFYLNKTFILKEENQIYLNDLKRTSRYLQAAVYINFQLKEPLLLRYIKEIEDKECYQFFHSQNEGFLEKLLKNNGEILVD